MQDCIKRWKQSILSGILVGIGVVINALAGDKYIGAMLFSLALLTIIHHQIPLYTGRIGYIRDNKVTYLLQVLGCNLIGVILPVLAMLYCKEDLYSVMAKAAVMKFSRSYLQLFLLGILCGVLMLIAVHTKNRLITVFCIMVFILSGYEHCIADFPFLVLNFSIMNLIKFLCIILGNSVGSIITFELFANGRREENTDLE